MTTQVQSQSASAAADDGPALEETEPPGYDRSSLIGDYMVMIADQTPEDFELYAPESRICEFIDGTIYMPSPATDRHQDQGGFLFHLLDAFRCERGGGPVREGPAVLCLSEQWKLEPDVFVRPDPRGGPPGAPALLVVEILSRSTRSHNLGKKLSIYQSAAIPEIWLVDERDRTVIVERRIGEDYQRQRWTEGRLDSSALPGFWIDVAWLWEEPLPNARRCLDQILARPPV